MKALTLWQPWATLVELGAKTVETRSWSTSYRGPLAIHAAKRPVPERLTLGGYEAWPADQRGRIHPNHTEERPDRLYRNSSSIRSWGSWRPLPHGCVIATCWLVDVVPVEELRWNPDDLQGPPECHGWVSEGPAWRQLPRGLGENAPVEVYVTRRERSFGNFAAGRFAWLLEHVRPVEPVQARGRQQLWDWDEERAA